MTLSCSCNDFDKSEHETWFEPGRASVPPPGERCCECNAQLPQERCATILCGEAYEPNVTRPPHPDDVLESEPEDFNLARHWGQRYDAMEAAVEAFNAEHGWDCETERFERYELEYRCERCSGLVEAIEELGYCMMLPGELAENHAEYVEQSGGHEVIWKPNRDGIWNPHRMTRADFARREAKRRWHRAGAFVRYGWKLKLRYTVWPWVQRWTSDPIMRRMGYQRRYDYQTKRLRWKRVEEPA